MIKFVVLEKNTQFQKEIIDVIDKLVFKTKYEYKIEKYKGYNTELANTIKDCSIKKIYIINIELEGSKSGLSIAQEIRVADWDSEIIIVTNHDEMFETVFRSKLKVFDFVEKFHEPIARIENNLNQILEHKDDKAQFFFGNNKERLQIYLKDITYICRDTQERKLIILTSNSKYEVKMTVAEILEKLDPRFKQIHRACIVNNDRVVKYHWVERYFILDNGEKVNLCSKLYK